MADLESISIISSLATQTEDGEDVSLLPCANDGLNENVHSDHEGAGQMAVGLDVGSAPLHMLSSYSIVRLKAITATLCGGFFSLGILTSLLGPTLLDLACNTSSNLGTLAYVFTARSSGYLAGSVIGGFLFDRFEANMLLAISQLISAAGAFAVPFCTDVVALASCIVSGGIAMGFLDTGGNVLVLRLWGDKSAPYLQSLHFAFGLGAFVAPLMAKPFLTTTPQNTSTDAEFRACTDNGDLSANMTDLCGTNYSPVFRYSFWIAAILLCITALVFMYFAFAVRLYPSKATHTHTCTTEKIDSNNEVDKSGESPHNKDHKHNDRWYVAQILSLMFVFYFFYIGIEVTYGGYIASYAVCSLDFSKSTAAILTSVFWGTFALARAVSILLAAYKLSPGMMMVIDIIGSISAMIFLSAFLSSKVILWVGSAVLGASIASMFPTAISWAEQYIEITGKRAAVFVVGASFGEMVVPLVTGRLFTVYKPSFFIYCTFASTVTATLLFVMLVWRANPSRIQKWIQCQFYWKLKQTTDIVDKRDASEMETLTTDL